MATNGGGRKKSAFLRELFGKKPDLKLDQATEAWQEAGNEGVVSSSLFYNVKRAVSEGAGGGASDGGAAPRKAKAKAGPKEPKGKRATQEVGEVPSEPTVEAAAGTAVRTSAPGVREGVLDRVEDGIDDLILELKQLGGMEEALESLRKVRRVVVRSHEG